MSPWALSSPLLSSEHSPSKILDAKQTAEALQEQASDPQFFGLTEEGNDALELDPGPDANDFLEEVRRLGPDPLDGTDCQQP